MKELECELHKLWPYKSESCYHITLHSLAKLKMHTLFSFIQDSRYKLDQLDCFIAVLFFKDNNKETKNSHRDFSGLLLLWDFPPDACMALDTLKMHWFSDLIPLSHPSNSRELGKFQYYSTEFSFFVGDHSFFLSWNQNIIVDTMAALRFFWIQISDVPLLLMF